jgi:hypothetical protein
LSRRRNGDKGELKLAGELRSETTMPLAWIANRLGMGCRGYLASLLGQSGKPKRSQSIDQPMLRI